MPYLCRALFHSRSPFSETPNPLDIQNPTPTPLPRCSELQCVAVCCSVLQHATVCCSVPQCCQLSIIFSPPPRFFPHSRPSTPPHAPPQLHPSTFSERHCTYDNGTLLSAADADDTDPTQRTDVTGNTHFPGAQQLRDACTDAARKAKHAAIQTSRLMADMEHANTQAAALAAHRPESKAGASLRYPKS